MQSTSIPKVRQRHADVAALLVLSVTGSEWVSAVAAADRVGSGYRPLAFAFRRLVERGLAVERVVTYKGSARSKEEKREYRLADAVSITNPFVPVALPKAATGRIIRSKWSMCDRWGRQGQRQQCHP